MASMDSQLYYSAKLLTVYTFDSLWTDDSLHPDGWVSAICLQDNNQDDVSILTFCNRSNDSSSYSLDKLLQQQESVSVNTITRNKEILFKDIWPLQQQQSSPYGSITTTIPVSSNHLAIGYENGTICVVPLSMALLYLNQLSDHLHNRQDTRLFEKAHHGKVTCLLVPEHHGSSEQKHLLSGGRDGCVKIWNIINGKFVASFTVHTSPVESFVEPAEQKDSRIRGCIVSIAYDHSLALISVDSMACLYIIPGYTYPLVRIQWRPSEDYVLFAYGDDTVFVWQLQAGHLDRVLTGKSSKQVMADNRWPCNRILQSTSRKTNANINHTVHTKSILSKSQDLYTDRLFAQVFLFNVRRLVFDLNESSTIRMPPNAYNESSQEVPQPTLSSSSTILPTLSTSTTYSPELADPLDTKHDDDLDTTPKHPTTISTNNKCDGDEQHRLKKRELVSAVMSIIISTGTQSAFEQPWLSHDDPSISYGIRGVNGYLSLMAPCLDGKQSWMDSSTLTATRLLSIAFLSEAVDKNNVNKIDFANYVKELGDRIGSAYCPPSLSLLSKYWQDPEARGIFSMAMVALDTDQLHELVDYWKNYRIIGCDQSHVLNERLRKSTALSLTLLLSDTNMDDTMEQEGTSQPDTTQMDAITLTRILSSMELLSQGFTTWEAYINASNVLRTLITFANQTGPSLAPGRVAIRQGAKNAIFTIARNNHMSLVIGTLTYDTTRARKIDHRLACLKIISSFIRKDPSLLYGHVYQVIEAVVKTLDPNIPHMRESVLAAATATLHDLVKRYPSVDFSSSTQKLVVGTLEGATIVYDLQTATRSVVFEGHTGPVSVVKFSPDGKLIATGSLTDCTVRVWYSQLSLLGIFTSSFTKSGHAQTPGSQKPYKIFSFALPEQFETQETLQFEWRSNRCVKLCIKDIVMSFNV
ncbi:hypothetical protein BC941DRAFT_368797 [Chlamydoabsidia padenii]|nr:hypothetical protein BC941DRAFT_368797 [Chlamydoabsidia padenii]